MATRSETAVRAAGLVVFVGFIPLLLVVPDGRSWFWNVAITLLPLGFVVGGFYAWRRVCPLAWFGQLGQRLGKPGKRKVGERLERVYPLLQLGILVAALALRHVALDGDATALAGFLVGLIAAAALTSFLLTGKTWCNFVCPVGLVEKLCSEPIVLRSQDNSQCTPCTACKKSCPDIDLELGYWKELSLPARRLAAFAWPGVVFGYFALQFTTFPPWLAPVIAAPLTIVAGGAASFAVAAIVERLFLARSVAAEDRARVRHRALALCGFAGFLVFYAFAGVPALLAAAIVATVILVRRWDRREDDYVQEKFARGILARWEWGDEPPAGDLGGLYVLHTERQRQREQRLAAYKDTLVEMIADGVMSRGAVAMMSRLRAQLGISERDHDKVLAELSTEARQLFDPAFQGSAEKRLMLAQLRADVERLLIHGAAGAAALEALRVERGVSDDDWAAVVDELRAPAGAVGRKLGEALDAAATLRRAGSFARRVDPGSRTVGYFGQLVDWRLRQHRERARALLTAVPDESLAARLDAEAAPGDGGVADLVAVAADASPYLRAAAAHVLSRFDEPGAQAAVAAAAVDAHPLVRETAVRALSARGRLTREVAARAMNDPDPRVARAVTRVAAAAGGAGGVATLDREAALDTLSGYERMTFLGGVPLFADLAPGDLEALSGLTREQRFAAGQTVCVEGDDGRDVYVVIEGRARAWLRGDGGAAHVLGDSGPGACIGEMAALDEAPRTATVTASVDLRALVLPGTAFKELLAERPEIAREVLRVLSARLRGMINQSQQVMRRVP